MLESGITNGATKAEAFTAAGNRLVSSPKRAMHVYVEPTWNNKLVVMFEQSECYANNAYDSLTFDGDYLSNGTLVNPRWGYGRTSVRWDVSLKVWAGTFRK